MSILGDIAKISIGTAIGNKGLRNDLAEDRRMRMEEAKAIENEERYRRARESQKEWEAVRQANMERRRNGQPELPYPPRYYY